MHSGEKVRKMARANKRKMPRVNKRITRGMCAAHRSGARGMCLIKGGRSGVPRNGNRVVFTLAVLALDGDVG